MSFTINDQNLENLISDLGDELLDIPSASEKACNKFMNQNQVANYDVRMNTITAKMALYVVYGTVTFASCPELNGFNLVVSKEDPSVSRIDIIANPTTKESIYTFRGTVENSLQDWEIDFDASYAKDEDGIEVGYIHAGLKKKMSIFWADPDVQKQARKDLLARNKIIITGHSQGGGSAAIFAGRLTQLAKALGVSINISVITFESMRAGDEAYSKELARRVPNYTRIQLDGDPVPQLAPSYWNVGSLISVQCNEPIGVLCHLSENIWENYIVLKRFQKVVKKEVKKVVNKILKKI